MNTKKLATAVEAYFADLRQIRASGGATAERSYYPPLTNLLNAVGGTLKPKVFCVSELAQQGADHPTLASTLQSRCSRENLGKVKHLNVVWLRSSPLVTTLG